MPVPAAITAIAGAGQRAAVGSELPESIVVRVVDSAGQPLSRQMVRFRVVSGSPAAGVEPATALTDAAGRAATQGRLGTRVGPWELEARTAQLTVRVAAEGIAAAPDSMYIVRGQDLGGRVGELLRDSLVIEVVDRFGNPTPGVGIGWQAEGGGAVIPEAAGTGPDGRSAVERRLGPTAGPQETLAILDGVRGSPLAFNHVAAPGDAATLSPVSGGDQVGAVGQALAQPLVVAATDASGNPVAGVAVSWTVTAGGGSLDGAGTTDPAGRASAVWTLGGTAGVQSLEVSPAGVSPVTFTATATPGPAVRISLTTQPSEWVQSGAVFSRQPAARLEDAWGNPTEADGVTVTVALADGPGGTLGGTLAAVTSGGTATFTDLKITGKVGQHTLRFDGAGLPGATSGPITVAPGPPAAVTIVTQPSGSATAWQPFARQPEVEVRDAGDNLLDGVRVDATIQSGGGTLLGATGATTAGGVAGYTDLAIGGSAGSRTLRFAAGAANRISNSIAVSLPPEATTGRWSGVESWPIVAVHLHLLPDGRVLAWGRAGTPEVWNPATGGFTAVPSPAWLFCAGHTFLPDGRLLVTGGHIDDGLGLPDATIFDYRSDSWSRGPAMQWGRWYPTSTTLANGEVLTVAGTDTAGVDVVTPEVWRTSGGWRKLTGAPLNLHWYPRLFQAPNGRVFYAGPEARSRYLNTSGDGSWTELGRTIQQFRSYGSAVMYQPGKVLIVGGGESTDNDATNTAEVIDLNRSSPSWRAVAPMAFARRQLNATLLPTGDVVVTGGTSRGFNDPAGAVHAAELWNPVTERWTTLAANSVIRMYHSTTLLLPDGRLLHAGSGDGAGAANERSAELFSPPYLFKGPRPTISDAPSSVGYNQSFEITSPEGASIAQVTLVRLGSVTHAFDLNQRFNRLNFTRTTNGVSARAPSSGNLAPPGHYMLFLVNGDGVPSVARIIQLH